MSRYNSYVVILLLAMALSESSVVLGEYHVHIVNGLGNNNILNVHCQSKDNDLGWHALAKGEDFHWSFNMNFFKSTLFFCFMQWKEVKGSFKVFSNDMGLNTVCPGSVCTYRADENGLSFYNNSSKTYELLYEWEK
ncbi:hypothetical protein HHK36_027009 [Tetracentron sinense]|uniref:S-protein homolog n=1 Tax=Tetracentron sinense TaxID=13715 RepID=A0A834YKI0_TETSI|nr:hypothetical protein HHK36_027009 [Tetracentron sinense]